MEGLAKTADHAARGKQAAVTLGYYPNEFARLFAGPSSQAEPSPGALINRGQYARVAAIGSACEQFLGAAAAAAAPAQIVSLGAGFDTLWWQLRARGAAPRLFVELDQEAIVRRKCAIVSSKATLHRAFPEGAACVTPDGIASEAAGYRLAMANLNDLGALEAALDAAGWRAEEPTLLLAECFLVYLEPEAARGLLGWFGARCPRAVHVSYDVVGPDDPFGRTMVDNLRRRGCPLLGLAACPDAAAQSARCVAAGWDRADTISLLAFFDEVVAAPERARVCRLELLDELEEWRLLLSHYSITLAVSDRGGAADGGAADGGSPIFAGIGVRVPVSRAYPPAPEGGMQPPAIPPVRREPPKLTMGAFAEEEEGEEEDMED